MKITDLFEQPRYTHYVLEIVIEETDDLSEDDILTFIRTLGGDIKTFRRTTPLPGAFVGVVPEIPSFFAKVLFDRYEQLQQVDRMIRRRQRGKPPLNVWSKHTYRQKGSMSVHGPVRTPLT